MAVHSEKQASLYKALPLVIISILLVICVIGAYAINTKTSITGAGIFDINGEKQESSFNKDKPWHPLQQITWGAKGEKVTSVDYDNDGVIDFANYSTYAGYADSAGYADNAKYALEAGKANLADSAEFADVAKNVNNLYHSDKGAHCVWKRMQKGKDEKIICKPGYYVAGVQQSEDYDSIVAVGVYCCQISPNVRILNNPYKIYI